MIANGLKKLAKEYNMHVSHGVAYGSLGGFAATMDEGAGYKRICFSLLFTDGSRRSELMDVVNGTELQRSFRVQNLGFGPRSIEIRFSDTIGTMKKIREFLNWFLPLLQQYGASPANICTECGMEIMDGCWGIVNGTAYHFHNACAERIKQDIAADNVQRAEADRGNYLTGLLGALCGSLLGAIVWALVLSMGYIASIVGLLIGWLAEKGYDLFHGKQGKAKVLILIIAIVLGVLVGTFALDACALFTMIQSGELYGWRISQIPQMILMKLQLDSEYAGGTVKNILTGLLFAALGAFALLRKTGKNVADTKYIDLP